MNRKEEILLLAKSKGILRPLDVEKEGISREYLIRLYKEGHLSRIGRGLYTLPDFLGSEAIDLAEVSKRAPRAVVCLISALGFYNLTTQIPHEVWIAIENRDWKPKINYPPVRVVRFSGESFQYGISEHILDGVKVKIYSPAKTLVDCFKFRNKIGLDVAIEAAKDIWRERMATMDDIWKAAEICRMTNVMRPYLEAIVHT